MTSKHDREVGELADRLCGKPRIEQVYVEYPLKKHDNTGELGRVDVLTVTRLINGYRFCTYYEHKSSDTKSNRRCALRQASVWFDYFDDRFQYTHLKARFVYSTPNGFERWSREFVEQNKEVYKKNEKTVA